MGEPAKSLVQTRWVVFAALVIAVVALGLAGYAAYRTGVNAEAIVEVVKALPGK